MTLSDQAATGSADREAVAIALGWAKTGPASGINRGHWILPNRSRLCGTPPDYPNDLAATLAEIERRGWEYHLSHTRENDLPVTLAGIEPPETGYDPSLVEKNFCTVWTGKVSDVRGYMKHGAGSLGTTIANAACAALLKALENSDDN